MSTTTLPERAEELSSRLLTVNIARQSLGKPPLSLPEYLTLLQQIRRPN